MRVEDTGEVDAEPGLGPFGVRSRLEAVAERDPDRAWPNPAWGNGRLDVPPN